MTNSSNETRVAVQIRVTPETKELWLRAAGHEPLSRWARRMLTHMAHAELGPQAQMAQRALEPLTIKPAPEGATDGAARPDSGESPVGAGARATPARGSGRTKKVSV